MRLLVVSCAPAVSSFTLSVACLLLTAIAVHDTCDCDGPFPLVIVQSAPFYPCVSVSLSSVFHTQSHTLTLLLMSLFVFALPTCQLCCDGFPCRAPSCPSASVMSEFWWNLTSRPSGDDMPDESLNQYLPVFPLVSFIFLIVFDSVPSKPTLQALYISSPTCCVGTAMFRRYLGSLGQPRPAGWISPSP